MNKWKSLIRLFNRCIPHNKICIHRWKFSELRRNGFTVNWSLQPVPNYSRIEICTKCDKARTTGQFILFGDNPLSKEEMQSSFIAY